MNDDRNEKPTRELTPEMLSEFMHVADEIRSQQDQSFDDDVPAEPTPRRFIPTDKSEALYLQNVETFLKDENPLDDIEVAVRLCAITGESIQHFSDNVRDEPAVVYVAYTQNPESFQFASQRIQDEQQASGADINTYLKGAVDVRHAELQAQQLFSKIQDRLKDTVASQQRLAVGKTIKQ